MADIAVLIDDMFEDSEYLEPVAAFRKAGHEIVHVGLRAGKTVKGKKKHTPVVVQRAVGEVSASEFDALLIPGGYSPDKLRADQRAVNFVKQFMDADKPVFSICHGPQLLISAKAVKDRHVTGWKSITQDLINAGAVFHDRQVVIDGNLVSSRSPADLPAFIKASLKKIPAPEAVL